MGKLSETEDICYAMLINHCRWTYTKDKISSIGYGRG
ncbi:hypothetical protein RHECNPAF_12210049 [Rhizobium etli CNPAF512]|nr:hypothetical protein RHECNPAF_12210049 [Rhizobium etli CNPAF512]